MYKINRCTLKLKVVFSNTVLYFAVVVQCKVSKKKFFTYSHGKKDTDPYNISTMEIESL